MLAAAVNFGDARLAGNSNFARFELILKCGLAKGTILTLAPRECLSILAAEKAHVTTACNAIYMAHREVLDEHW